MITYLAVWNVIVFLIYGLDKLKAMNNSFRISERILISCAFLMGGIGALSGMQVFRHKTKKAKFNILIPLSVICNVAVLYYLVKK